MVDHLKKLTEDYIDKTNDLLASRKLGEGFFGMPDSAKSHPCHTEYFNAVENTVKEYIAGEPDAETAEAAVRFLRQLNSSLRKLFGRTRSLCICCARVRSQIWLWLSENVRKSGTG